MRTIIVIIIVSMTSMSLISQSRRAEMRDGLEARKVAFITEELALTAEEAQTFWPVYNAHEDSVAALRKKYPSTRNQDLKGLTDLAATAVIDNYILREKEKLALKTQLIKDLDGVISNRKVAVLLGLEGEFKRRLLKAMNKRRGNNNR